MVRFFFHLYFGVFVLVKDYLTLKMVVFGVFFLLCLLGARYTLWPYFILFYYKVYFGAYLLPNGYCYWNSFFLSAPPVCPKTIGAIDVCESFISLFLLISILYRFSFKINIEPSVESAESEKLYVNVLIF